MIIEGGTGKSSRAPQLKIFQINAFRPALELKTIQLESLSLPTCWLPDNQSDCAHPYNEAEDDYIYDGPVRVEILHSACS